MSFKYDKWYQVYRREGARSRDKIIPEYQVNVSASIQSNNAQESIYTNSQQDHGHPMMTGEVYRIDGSLAWDASRFPSSGT